MQERPLRETRRELLLKVVRRQPRRNCKLATARDPGRLPFFVLIRRHGLCRNVDATADLEGLAKIVEKVVDIFGTHGNSY
jgi:hypothetical protein